MEVCLPTPLPFCISTLTPSAPPPSPSPCTIPPGPLFTRVGDINHEIPQSPSSPLSRSSSFAPGPHRRSHPNLQHLSLAPLTPKYPIDPADYAAYFDPATSELHTSASISHVASLPSPGGILSRSGSAAQSRVQSRASSRTRMNQKKKNRSFVTTQAPLPLTDGGTGVAAPLSGELTSEGLGHKSISRLSNLANLSAQQTHNPSDYSGGQSLHKSDSSWFIQTGLALTEGSRESKGQSWIFKRDSSTSLATPVDERPSMMIRSGRATPSGNLSRRGSFQRRSKRSLAMTPVPATTPMINVDTTPDWADEQTQAEIAAQMDAEFADELDDGDPYGTLDFEAQFDSDDEEELRKSISGYRLGRWMDGLVDVFLRLEDDFSASQVDLEAAKTGIQADPAPSNAPPAKDADPPGHSVRFDDSVEPPPDRPRGVWDDVVWFGRMLARAARS
ncbi:uncharacterized protein Z519_04099 [Cladophialophora bantiana CBS 173.52]|uniref:Uncharacterized protein n=1 Tax=Cladophialophora bantiana (strain ATCC 10958 / CBS 173.52 / CDC B-1940 / NIH 8579) TaxID=1442370 RepID=A0A0D2IFI0_CLAB1|nr:uncharacterized protein Z519_04099 [Cladophialophora bantiana CBS 173.52]KIW95514.1 hypothetical protein Z519_04099 [Cladophialophora bantiana CBS 173.52]